MIMGRQQVELPLPQNKKKSSDDIFFELIQIKLDKIENKCLNLFKRKYLKHIERNSFLIELLKVW